MVPDTLVIGLGNPLRGDDGLGVRVAGALAAQALPRGVEVVDGGTAGLDLVNLMEGWPRVIVVDAANVGREPGQFVCFTLDDVRWLDEGSAFSVHAAGLGEALLLAQVLGTLPEEVIIFGVQPACLDWQEGLSPQVEAALPDLLQSILSQAGGSSRAGCGPDLFVGREEHNMAKILVIDDDPDAVMAMRIPLEANGHEVYAANSGQEGLARLVEVNPDLVILDVMMDTATEGFQLSQTLRDRSPDAPYAAYRDVPILMLTAVHSTTELRFAPDEDYLPVDAFMEKSSDPEQIVSKVQELVDWKTGR